MKDNKKYQVVIDQSTSGTKLLLFQEMKIVKRYDKKHRQIYPQPGWVEHDPVEIVENVEMLFEEMLKDSKIEIEDIKSISITNQRETIVAWDKVTGKPLYNAIVWQCNRSEKICKELLAEAQEEILNQKTGLRIDPYFSGTKIKWLVENVTEIQEKMAMNELAIGTIDSWLLWNLTNERAFFTEPSNACRTLLYNIEKNNWDKKLVAMFGITMDCLPKVINSSSQFGTYKGIPIQGIMADSQAALLGEGCLKEGDMKVTMGTGCSIMMQLEEQGNYRSKQILTTIAWEDRAKTYYALEGIIRSCGDSLNWFIENVADFANLQKELDIAAQQLTKSDDLFFVPALEGLGAPFWENTISASFVGMTRSTTKYDLLRAVLGSIVFQIKLVIETVEEVYAKEIREIKVDGGVSRNHELMQHLSSLLNKKIVVSEIEEFSAYGVLLASQGICKEENRMPTLDYFPKEQNEELLFKYNQWLNIVLKFIKK